MKTQIIIAAVIASFVSPIAFGQMGGYGGGMSQHQPPQTNGDQSQPTQTTTKTTMPVGVKGYLENVMANSKDHRFHMSVNGKDLPLTPVKFHEEQKLAGGKGAAAVDMKGVDGKTYEIDFVTSGGVVTDGKIRKINGKAP